MKNVSKIYKRKNGVIPTRINTTVEEGLSTAEVFSRKKMGYDNPDTNKKSTTILGIIASECFTYFNMIFFMIATILIIIGAYTQLTFLVVVLSNLFIGIFQRIKSKNIVDKLSLVTASKVNVIRDSKEQEILTTDIVLDDVFKLKSGQQIACDAIVLQGDLKVNESLLTGETLPVIKNVGDTVLSGSFVVSGNAYVRAEKVGGDTFVLQLTNQAKKYKKPNSIILNTLNTIIKFIGIIIIPIAILLFWRTYKGGILNDTITSTAGAILGMIPSGLFLLTSTALVVSVIRLAKKKTLVQELYCIEMLARVDTVCMDKTGTITDGSMILKDVVSLSKNYDKQKVTDIIKTILANVEDDNDTARALKKAFGSEKILEATSHFNFSSETKFSCVNIKKIGACFMGAPEKILDKEKNADVIQQVNQYASKGYRVLAICQNKTEYNGKGRPSSVTPIGLIVLEDNVRQDAIETIKYFKENGVGLKVISGDNPITVSEVALRAGIEGAEKYISLDGLSDEEVLQCANQYTVFGRVVPHQKKLLIQALKKAGHTTAMIGDGVNDILALKEADCSIAIGAGADAARRVSQLILTDSNFCAMQEVVAEGRRVTNNIKISAPLFLTKTIYSVLFSLFCIIFAFEYPFSPVQLVIMEFCAIGIPSFALALQPNRDLIKGRFLRDILVKSLVGSLTALTIAIFLYSTLSVTGLYLVEAQTIIVVALTINALFVIGRVSWPFNWYRFILLLLMTILVICAFFGLSNLYGTSLFDGTPLYNLIQIDQMRPIGYKWLYIILGAIPVLLTIYTIIEKIIYACTDKKQSSKKIPMKIDEEK